MNRTCLPSGVSSMWRLSAAAVFSGLARVSRLKDIKARSKAARRVVWCGVSLPLGMSAASKMASKASCSRPVTWAGLQGYSRARPLRVFLNPGVGGGRGQLHALVVVPDGGEDGSESCHFGAGVGPLGEVEGDGVHVCRQGPVCVVVAPVSEYLPVLVVNGLRAFG